MSIPESVHTKMIAPVTTPPRGVLTPESALTAQRPKEAVTAMEPKKEPEN